MKMNNEQYTWRLQGDEESYYTLESPKKPLEKPLSNEDFYKGMSQSIKNSQALKRLRKELWKTQTHI